MGHWSSCLSRVKRQSVDEKASLQIYRQRYLTKYLSLWLSRLHLVLRKKHLKTLKPRGNAKRRFFCQWVNTLRKIRYLRGQEETISRHKNGMALHECLSALKAHRDRRVEQRRREGVAMQERRYWLAREAMANIRSGIEVLRH